MVHRDFHPGNILFKDTFTSFYRYNTECNIRISDMGLCSLCEEVGKTDESKLCGVMPYMAPEVLRSNPYTQAADIYSFGMIMYVIATGKQPFSDRAHDLYLALDICEDGIRPKIKEQEAPRCYIDLMEKCLDANPDNRPNAIEIQESFKLFKEQQQYEIEGQFKEADKYREIEAFIKRNQHPQAIYISRVLNLDFSISQPIYEPQNSIDVKHI
ncbi:kinase-like protein [Rhizophagus irregularis]|uniref:Kinase-like protein n=1 Tax=Rhizophagus irregularis TaxID=588596 RepID=A0A2N0PJR3_9GLOM|nr:kinase-like protein [Rhizophagus irregularis]